MMLLVAGLTADRLYLVATQCMADLRRDLQRASIRLTALHNVESCRYARSPNAVGAR